MDTQTTESTVQTPISTQETYSYRGWLNSNFFWKRALATLGYSLVGQLIIGVPLFVLGMLLSIFLASA